MFVCVCVGERVILTCLQSHNESTVSLLCHTFHAAIDDMAVVQTFPFTIDNTEE